MAKYIGMLNKIFSGNKADPERAAIDFAALNWIEIVAYVPPGFIPMKNNYKCEVHVVPSYNETKYLEENIHHSEGTVYFSLGEPYAKLYELEKVASLKSKPFLRINLTDKKDLDALRLVKKFCEQHSINSLHITGSSVGDENCYREVLNILDGLSVWGIQYNQPENDVFEQEDEEVEGSIPTKDIDSIYSRIQKEIDEISHYDFILNHAYIENRKTVYTDNGIPYVKIFDPDLYDPSYYEHDASVQSHLRATIIMLLFSKFEDWIEDICNSIQEKRKIPISRSDLTGNIIKSFRKYIKVFGGVTKPDANKWAVINALYQVRNILVHGGWCIERANDGNRKGVDLLIHKNSGIHTINRTKYEKQRENIISYNNKKEDEKSKLKIKTIRDLKQALDLDNQLIEVPPPLSPVEKYPERIHLLEDFPKFAVKHVKDFIGVIQDEHEKLYSKPRIMKRD